MYDHDAHSPPDLELTRWQLDSPRPTLRVISEETVEARRAASRSRRTMRPAGEVSIRPVAGNLWEFHRVATPRPRRTDGPDSGPSCA
jgi:hypothetical protein